VTTGLGRKIVRCELVLFSRKRDDRLT
jgi:hypothetical protein